MAYPFKDPFEEIQDELNAARAVIGYAEVAHEKVSELAGLSSDLIEQLAVSVKRFQDQIQDVAAELNWMKDAD